MISVVRSSVIITAVLRKAPSVVVNKPGGGGSVAFAYLKQKPGDAHSVVPSGAGAVVNSIMGAA